MAIINSSSLPDPSRSWVASVIEWSCANKLLILLLALSVSVMGYVSARQIAFDAIPDLSDTQVIVRTDWPGQAPQVIEDQITFPLSSQMLGLPKAKVVRGFSMFGSSFTYIIFEQDTDMYWARSRVLEALSQVRSRLPEGVEPQLGPDATGVGWVLQYALYDKTGQHDLADLRSLQDWFLRIELGAIEGVAEVASVGGFVKEWQVLVDPNKLRAFNVSLADVVTAVRGANQEVGGRTLEMAETEYLIRSFGYIQQASDLEHVVLTTANGIPVTLADVARIASGPALRRGIAELNGEGEVVGGIVIMRPGHHAVDVIAGIKAKLATVQQGLPAGVQLQIVYDRSELIQGSVAYLSQKLWQEALVVIFITWLFLLHVRSALVAVVSIPLGVLAALIVIRWQGITLNIMSLGGIAIAMGAMVDASIVMVENAHRKLSQLSPNASPVARKKAIITGAKEVGPGIFFSLLIITLSFLPIFLLNAQAERLFSPLAYTKTYAMAAAAFLSVTLVPVLMLYCLRGPVRAESSHKLMQVCIAVYRPLLNAALRFRKTTVLLACIALLSSAIPLSKLGAEFMPPLDEGSFLYMPMTLPGLTPAKAREILQVTNRQILTVPEVAFAFGKAGRANTATDPAPLSMIETWVQLKPKSAWREGMTTQALMAELNNRVGLPGMVNSWGYPIKTRLDMLSTGIRTPVGIKITGDNLTEIDRMAGMLEQVIAGIPGTQNVIADRTVGSQYIEIIPKRQELARYGIALASVQQVIQVALGGQVLSEAVVGRERYGLTVRYDQAFRSHITHLNEVLVATPHGASISLATLADIRVAQGPAMIKTENARLTGWVFVDISSRDMGAYIQELNNTLAKIAWPAGYTFKITGEFEQMQAASQRLKIAIPATLLLIFTLLFLHFGRTDRALFVMLSVPFGLLGGLWWLWFAGYNFSVATAVGFVALAGIAAETVIIMLMYIDQEMRVNWPTSQAALTHNIQRGALLRLRPKLMTVLTIVAGLIPIFLSDGPGADVMRRIALPMVGGMVSTLVLTLLVLPAIYSLYMQSRLSLPKPDQ